ncbi:MAG: hypothetical protein ACNI3C_00720 [Candidatus Marinarcus sp.]|uniref:hypothetical protein n=1 Tax=Candidatus Marinarcus sp. TaxID=3100987 RepID=UPI003B00AEAE
MHIVILTSAYKESIFSFLKGLNIENCRNCKREIEANVKKCPYCGILNPTIKIKDVWIGIAVVLGFMSFYMLFFK